ncbi:hypothetical protein BVAVS116_K0019 (plasmid) [Borreliella valaisiana VS116]|uniref:Uncharacterized protein n=1 Tax=Borreliella valaisiana VS116 TaxID=445987 RepID=C0R8L2_BORVA|nr:hypothetical protein BVAVS116_K0019 [Borreliella valaisiana VS116]
MRFHCFLYLRILFFFILNVHNFNSKVNTFIKNIKKNFVI